MFVLGDKEEAKGIAVEDADEEDADSEREDADLSQGSTMLVVILRDRRRKYISAREAPRKGSHPYTVRRRGQDITQVLGYNRVHIKSDLEPSVKRLKAQVQLEYSIEVPGEESWVGDSQSNGEIENTNQQVQAHIRTQKAHLEYRLGNKVPMDSDLLPWMVRQILVGIMWERTGSQPIGDYRGGHLRGPPTSLQGASGT